MARTATPRFVLSILFTILLVWSSGCDPTTPGTPDPAPTPAVRDPVTPPDPGARRPLTQREVVPGDALKVPFILWGGDMATFYANGGPRTVQGSVFADQGLVLELAAGDDFDQQIRDYTNGSSPFLRGTFRMIGTASEKFGTDPDARPMVFMQMTWSAGDHLVAREQVETLDDLKGKKLAVQRGGPHVGMLDDVLSSAQLSWNDVTVVWADNITGPGSPPELFRSDPTIDAAFAVTPDMIGLTGGLDTVGSGAEGTVKGSHVAVSTAELSRSIADVYAVRSDFWREHPDVVKKFTVGYLRAVEQLIDLKKAYEGAGSEPYMDLLQLSQDMFGADVIPTLEEDAHGLLSDCTFVGHPGNVAFFSDPKNPHGFDDFNERSLDLAIDQGWATKRIDLEPSPIDWESPEIKGALSKTAQARSDRFDAEAVLTEIESMDADGVLDSRTLLSFTIAFQPNQTEFDARLYSAEYARVFELAHRYGNAAVVIRGHSDTTLVLRDAVKAGLENGGLRRAGSQGNYQYFLDGRPLNIEDPAAIAQAIQDSSAFQASGEFDPRKTMQAALNLSRERSVAVRESLLAYGQDKSLPIDQSQIQVQGVGIREPLVARPRNPQEAAVNMRVEFRLVRVSAEAMTSSDFDF